MVEEKNTGVSQPAASMARTIDRLPPGDYIIKLVKPDTPLPQWVLEILHTDIIHPVKQEVELRSKK